MTIHRRDLPDAPVRVMRSRLNTRYWIWMCWSNGTTTSSHQQRHTSWEDAFADAEKHRRLAHAHEREQMGAWGTRRLARRNFAKGGVV